MESSCAGGFNGDLMQLIKIVHSASHSIDPDSEDIQTHIHMHTLTDT